MSRTYVCYAPDGLFWLNLYSKCASTWICHANMHKNSNQFKSPSAWMKNIMKKKVGRFYLKRVSVSIKASVCKLTTRATLALLFWLTWPASSVCKPTTFVVTERSLRSTSRWWNNQILHLDTYRLRSKINKSDFGCKDVKLGCLRDQRPFQLVRTSPDCYRMLSPTWAVVFTSPGGLPTDRVNIINPKYYITTLNLSYTWWIKRFLSCDKFSLSHN